MTDSNASPDDHAGISRRRFVGVAAGVTALAAATGVSRIWLWERFRWREDFLPGSPPTIVLEPSAWTTTDDSVRLAVLGDNGSGGRNAMAIGSQMARTYQDAPYGVVLLLGDISYYGSIDDRYKDVFLEPYGPLIDAGVEWELAIGNHEIQEESSQYARQETDAQLQRFGKPGTYYLAQHGPADIFVLDSSTPLILGEKGPAQRVWLEQALADSTAPWKIAMLHHPLYSSGRHGSNLQVRHNLEPILIDGGVDLVLTGHDHHYERTAPQDDVTYVVSGGGCKLTSTGSSDFTAYSESVLQFMDLAIDGDRLDARCIGRDGRVIDEFTLSPRSAG